MSDANRLLVQHALADVRAALEKAKRAEHARLRLAQTDITTCERRGGYIALVRFGATLRRIEKKWSKP